MAASKEGDDKSPVRRARRARTPQQREDQLINLAMDAAERMLESSNPPAQVVTHYLKLGSSEAAVERRFKEEQIRNLELKSEAYASMRRTEELMGEALNAFRSYSTGKPPAAEEDQ